MLTAYEEAQRREKARLDRLRNKIIERRRRDSEEAKRQESEETRCREETYLQSQPREEQKRGNEKKSISCRIL